MAERRPPLFRQRDVEALTRACLAAGEQIERAGIDHARGVIFVDLKARPSRGPCIYVLCCSDRSPVKIGFTNGPISARIKDLQTGNPHELICIFSAPATRQDEHSIHLAFARDRVQGEWFKQSARLSKFLNAVGRGESIQEALLRA